MIQYNSGNYITTYDNGDQEIGFYKNKNGLNTNVLFLRSPYCPQKIEEIKSFYNKGYYILGVSSYQQFPNPLYTNKSDTSEYIFHNKDIYERLYGWLHIFRNTSILKNIPHTHTCLHFGPFCALLPEVHLGG